MYLPGVLWNGWLAPKVTWPILHTSDYSPGRKEKPGQVKLGEYMFYIPDIIYPNLELARQGVETIGLHSSTCCWATRTGSSSPFIRRPWPTNTAMDAENLYEKHPNCGGWERGCLDRSHRRKWSVYLDWSRSSSKSWRRMLDSMVCKTLYVWDVSVFIPTCMS